MAISIISIGVVVGVGATPLHDVVTIARNKRINILLMIFTFPLPYLLLASAAQRFALPALGRAAERRPIGKRLRRRKMLENGAESPASGARFVGRGFASAFSPSKVFI